MNPLPSLLAGWRDFWGLSWWAKGPILGVFALLLVVTISVAAATGESDPSKDDISSAVSLALDKTPAPEATVLITRIPAPSPVIQTTVVVVTPTPPAEPTPTPEPIGPATTFGDGIHIVGTDIESGTYRSSPPDSCYWARLSGFSGDSDDIIANDNSVAPVVTIFATDIGFESSRCGTWTRID